MEELRGDRIDEGRATDAGRLRASVKKHPDSLGHGPQQDAQCDDIQQERVPRWPSSRDHPGHQRHHGDRSKLHGLREPGCECGVVGRTTKTNRRNWGAWTKVPKTLVVISSALTRYDEDTIFTGTNLAAFAGAAASPSLQTWDVVIANGPLTEDKHPIGTVTYRPPTRSIPLGDGHVLVSGKSSRHGSTDVAGLLPRSRDRGRGRVRRCTPWAQERAGDRYYQRLTAPT